MNQYHNHSTTPMLFHRIYWLIWTPAQIAMSVPVIIQNMRALGGADFFGVIEFGYSLVTALLMAAYFIGFFSWKLYGWYALMAQLVLNTAYAFASLFVLMGDDSSFAFALVTGTLIRCIPVGIYYYKRRPLFSAKGFDIPAAGVFFSGGAAYQRQNNPYQNQYNMNNQQNPQQTPPQRENPVEHTAENGERTYFCPVCGKEVKQTSNFCINCGAKLK